MADPEDGRRTEQHSEDCLLPLPEKSLEIDPTGLTGNSIQMDCRPNDQAAAGNSRRGHAKFSEGILAEQFVLFAALDDKGVAIFAEAENLSVASPG